MTVELVIFFVLAVIAVAAAVAMLVSDNAVYSALFLVLTMAVLSVFFLILNAPFIAMVQVTVYAGAIMVLFLFVIMLLGAEMLHQPSTVLGWQRAAMVVLGALFLVALGVVLFGNAFTTGNLGPAIQSADLPKDFGGPQVIGLALFQDYLLPFEITSFLLLLGMNGAVVLTQDNKRKRQ